MPKRVVNCLPLGNGSLAIIEVKYGVLFNMLICSALGENEISR